MLQEEIADVVVVGSGAGGLTAAVTAAIKGLSVVVLEKAPVYGGTTAISGGGTWIPCNPVARKLGVKDSREAARTYFEHSTGNRFDAARVDAFLDKGPEALTFLHEAGKIPFTIQADRPDYHPDVPGASHGGRVVYAAPFDGRVLGSHVKQLRPPLKELTLLGVMVRPGPDMRHFINATRSFTSFKFVAGRLGRYLRDLVFHGRSMELGNGNALVGRLADAAFRHNVDIRVSCTVKSLKISSGRVTGVEYQDATGAPRVFLARKGVVLAAGGFPHDVERRRTLMAHVRTGYEQKPASVDGDTGDGIRMAEAAGAAFDADLSDVAAWAPVSLVPQRRGNPMAFPHLIDRQKPGFIAVTRHGKRFVNESDSYHDFVRGLLKATADDAMPEAFLIADHSAIRRYGMGAVKPAPIPIFKHLRSGYLIRAKGVADLAAKVGIDPDGLQTTIDTYNAHARNGQDPEFNRGGNVYNRYVGDPMHEPNACVGPIENGPFYAIKIYPGDLGTFAGLKTDALARVLRTDGSPIDGLYAVGADMAHIMGGEYMSGGANLGPALTFGYIAGEHLATIQHKA